MTAKAAADIAAILDAYDFSRFATIADIGGGRGTPAASGARRGPQRRGRAVHERLTPHAGDFFADQLSAAGAYVLMEVIHDRGDAECVAILSAIRRAAVPARGCWCGVLPDEGIDPRGQTFDVIMLAVTGGREQTPSQLSELFNGAGFGDGTVTETAGPLRIVEDGCLAELLSLSPFELTPLPGFCQPRYRDR